jgi:urea carboxylase system permease
LDDWSSIAFVVYRPRMRTRDDSEDLARFGYRQELTRTLGSFSSFAAGFSYLSILTGLFQMFYLGFCAGGATFIWSWPLVLAGQFLVALGFAELAAHYPLSGGAYQWSKLTGSPRAGFIVGWIYLACLVVTLGAVALALQALLPQISPVFQVIGSARDPRASAMNAVLLGCGLIALTTALNSVRVAILARVYNTGVITELGGAILLAILLWAFATRSPADVLVAGAGGDLRLGPLFASALAASYVFYGFDTAGSLAEETRNPRRTAPRAILQAVAAAGVLGYLVLFGAMIAARDLSAGELGRIDGGLASIVTATLGGTVGRLLLLDVIFAIVVCALAVQASAVRLVFAMARDGLLPYSRSLASVSQVSKTPIVPAFIVGIAATVILVANINLPKLIELVTMVAALWANLAYLIVAALLLRRRLQGWPRADANVNGHFSLGRWGIPVNVAALAWSAFMVVNIGWPRAAIYGPLWQHRFAPLMLTVILVGTALIASALAYRRSVAMVAASPSSVEAGL